MRLNWLNGKGNEKEKLRKKMKELRERMAAEDVVQKSIAIANKLKLLAEYKEAKAVLFYAAKGNEVQTWQLISEAITKKKKALLPITDMKNRELKVAETSEYPKGLVEGKFGIMEPEKRTTFPEGEIDLAIIPGVAFSEEGYRLGYGLGFYDKLISRLRSERVNIRKIGLAYDFQIVDKIPKQEHDQRMDMIITEKKVIRPRILGENGRAQRI